MSEIQQIQKRNSQDPPLLINIPPISPTFKQSSFEESNNSTISNGWYNKMMTSLGTCLGGIGSIPLCPCFPNPYHQVSQGFVGLIEKFGRWEKTVDPGLIHVNPMTERLMIVDVRIQTDSVPSQILMTKDNVTISLDSVLYWHVVSPYTSQYGVQNVRNALIERTQTTLRHVVGNRSLQDVVERREELAEEIREIVEKPARLWGVQVESMLIKDMTFSNDLQDSLSSAAKSKRIGESKVIAAKAEVEAAQLMRHAADILASPAAMQLRYLETLASMSRNGNTKVIFMPTGMTGEFLAPLGAIQASVMEQLSED